MVHRTSPCLDRGGGERTVAAVTQIPEPSVPVAVTERVGGFAMEVTERARSGDRRSLRPRVAQRGGASSSRCGARYALSAPVGGAEGLRWNFCMSRTRDAKPSEPRYLRWRWNPDLHKSKDTIISGGENINAAEAEAALCRHAAVRECAVIGIPDERWGEVLRAFVVLKPQAQASESALLAFLEDQIARPNIPKSVVLVEALPHTGSGRWTNPSLRSSRASCQEGTLARARIRSAPPSLEARRQKDARAVGGDGLPERDDLD